MTIIGEGSGDYFIFKCTDCDEMAECEYLGWDPAIPHFRVKCGCKEEMIYKFSTNNGWKGLPSKPAKD